MRAGVAWTGAAATVVVVAVVVGAAVAGGILLRDSASATETPTAADEDGAGARRTDDVVAPPERIDAGGAPASSPFVDGVAASDRVRVKVVDAAGAPVPGLLIGCRDGDPADRGLHGETDANGDVRFEGLVGDVAWLTVIESARFEGRRAWRWAVERADGDLVADPPAVGAVHASHLSVLRLRIGGRATLRVASRPLLFGRVIDEDGAPVPGVPCALAWVFTGADDPDDPAAFRPVDQASSDSEGRISFRDPRAARPRARDDAEPELRVYADASPLERGEVERAAPSRPEIFDLGDLRLNVRWFVVRVSDDRGVPIPASEIAPTKAPNAGSTLVFNPRRGRPRPRAAPGEFLCRTAPGDAFWRATAPGYAWEDFPQPGGGPQADPPTVDVMLLKSAALRVLGAPGAPQGAAYLEADAPFFDRPDLGPSARTARTEFRDGAPAVFANLRPGVALRLRVDGSEVVDRDGVVVGASPTRLGQYGPPIDVAPLEPGETRDVIAPPAPPDYDVLIEVRDAFDDLASRVVVTATRGETTAQPPQVAEGRWRLTAGAGPIMIAAARGAARASATVDPSAVGVRRIGKNAVDPSGPPAVALRLPPTRRVELELGEGPNRFFAQAAHVSAEVDGEPVEVFHASTAPPTKVVVVAESSNVVFTVVEGALTRRFQAPAGVERIVAPATPCGVIVVERLPPGASSVDVLA
ncbi:MAG TPA: hypothetical protein VEI02_08165, partial [Planctomycetota bacterium]|nr:hypothetical protein [Planctomycetota bacterium]